MWFTEAERAYIGTLDQPGRAGLAHLATATPDGRPHVVPVRALLSTESDTVVVLGHSMARSYKYRQLQANPWVAVVWDGLPTGAGVDRIEGIEARGRATAVWSEGDADPHLVITPTKTFSWGLNEPAADSFERAGLDVAHLRAAERPTG
jgi:hypothetical protein